ncbi:MAG TPA: pyruvate formate lyase-activating protein [Hungateiclostridium thermocellum]|jgi:pyruvate formate lyase activating enzyme|uniref:Pyruvate formate-lyase-activating enzyme n=2 Tax=Acetivibrio thermocellus TaxID=1515 RepID=A3DCR4_ACET2|nr:pyruvate formate-lyase-activating protein [Acetivibrio thermocellus]CDG35218.1 Pyruvate formate-lyase 1-activating enzyme [Acetivibrio thermocellus BC1]ABN51743.1 pyruvate formate-lyase activating enzyme [Acetivibrio thermocellus ATCC 27405]ADU74773.1 pyruvate formate-lyase activating enzyme [Acetivibrio thermocellus DSM 1313]ALX08725.1 pyruvate formate-lyase activating enzyme [Acetivibrio thermocellus AD2]ANV76477.1 pyruvate formate-lyase activating enzyme [Acetivibrio thermocellus DSM 236
MTLKGRIHSFESFGTLDGPGIRFVVFMQGCPLRCIYCHNRDTWDVNAGSEYTPRQVIDEMMKYIDYIKVSGGGITVTGGEPVLQADFVAEVFRLAKEQGVHTALDTNGFADIEKVERLIKYTDLVLLDIKHAREDKHKIITGVSNEKIKRFALYLSDQGVPIWIRYVLVPGYTDDEDDLKMAADFIKKLKTVEKIEVLPYHNMGAYKWEKLGQKYMLEGVKGPSAQEVEKAKRILSGK